MEPGSFDGVEAFASSGAELLVDEPGDGSALGLVFWFAARTRDGGRERDLRTRAGPDAGGTDMFSGVMAGADIRRSGGKETGGIMARLGS